MLDIRSPLPAPKVPLATTGLGSAASQHGQSIETRQGKHGLITAASNPTVTYQASSDTVKISQAARHLAKVHRDRPVGAPGRPNTAVRGSSSEMPVRRQGDSGGFGRSNTFVDQVLGGSMPMGWLG